MMMMLMMMSDTSKYIDELTRDGENPHKKTHIYRERQTRVKGERKIGRKKSIYIYY